MTEPHLTPEQRAVTQRDVKDVGAVLAKAEAGLDKALEAVEQAKAEHRQLERIVEGIATND